MIIGNWLPSSDGDERAFALFKRHYSFHQYADSRRRPGYRNRFLFLGPGEKMVLLTQDCRAVIAFRKFLDDSGQTGINCALFRNEGDIRSSDLLREAEQIAWLRWPGERLYTYVDPSQIRTGQPKTGKPNPGKCFLKAGWHSAGTTKNGKLVFEKLPGGAT